MGIEKIDESAFKFNSYKCDAKVEFLLGSSKAKAEINGLRISINEGNPVRFAYEHGEGLVEVEKIDSKRNTNLLGNLLKIKRGDFQSYVDFITDYGFFFPIEKDRIVKVQPGFIVKYVDRLRVLTDLINEVGNPDFDFRKIVELSLYLIMDNGWEIDINGAKYHSYHYALSKLMEDPFNLPETVNKQDEINKKSFTIEDSIYGTYELSSKEYRDIIDGYSEKEGWDDYRFKALTYLYANKRIDDKKEREIIDFLFHYFHEMGIPKEIDVDGAKYYSRFNSEGFDNYNMLDSVVALGNYVISHEINDGILGIRPECDVESIKMKWIIPSLSNALYFSLFYLDKKKQMMRKCEHCGLYFVVDRSTSTKKYCSSYCRNNAQQAAHRLKLKMQAK